MIESVNHSYLVAISNYIIFINQITKLINLSSLRSEAKCAYYAVSLYKEASIFVFYHYTLVCDFSYLRIYVELCTLLNVWHETTSVE